MALRVRRQQVSQAIQAVGSSPSPQKDEQLLHSGRRRVSLITNRLTLLKQWLRQAVTSAAAARRRFGRRQASRATTKPSNAAFRSEAPIGPPRSGWRQAVNSWVGSAGSRLKYLGTLPGRLTRPAADQPSAKQPGQAHPGGGADHKPEMPAAFTLRRIEQTSADSATDTETHAAAAPTSTAATEPARSKSRVAQFLKRDTKLSPKKTAAKAIEQAQYQTAEDVLVSYIVQHTKDAQAYYLLGKVAIGRQDWDEAMEILEKAVELNPHQPGAQAALGHAAMRAGKLSRALQALQRAHDDDPQDVATLKNLLTIAKRMDNKVLQRSALEELVLLQPERQDYRQMLAAITAQQGSPAR